MAGSPLKSHSSGNSSSARGLGKSASSRLSENYWSLCDDYVSSNHPAKFECQRCRDVVRSSVPRMISKRPLLCKCRRSSNAKARQALPIYGDGKNVREWIHVSNHARGIQIALENGKLGEIYNIGTGQHFSNNDLASEIIRLMGFDESMKSYITDRQGHDFRY